MTRPGGSLVMPIIVAAAAASAIAFMGATVTEIGPWYHSLRQPAWAPSDAAYGIAWTIIYALTALAAVAAWSGARTRGEAEWIVGLFALNGFLNLSWSLLGFRLHRPDWAVAESVLLWLSVLSLVIVCGRGSRAAAVMLLPYLAWVSFALTLNVNVAQLNGPFA